ncbi:hypothetical protein HPP92_006525 [Vanilla planifolia]|uniref:Uncharacterized protein n=1 Tax=Vanilla planifolia TaxID=51239 RepID=A0A835RPH9_VANPL|nr:hypothetical protein HPP92_028207 [Vanilla planifolia]KAG0489662.1 hypothetical protein HPP92_006525 [Vanilla planifolia]
MDQTTVEKNTAFNSKQVLENFYLGIPDESVDLTFKYLAVAQQNEVVEMKSKGGESRATDAGRKGRESKSEGKDIAGNKGSRVRGCSHVCATASPMVLSSFFEGKGQTQRQGIPHSNICTLCDVYIHFFRHRCLVCGRVYCKSCLRRGMGNLTEGRKCLQCLGRRYSQRYIQRAGKPGCCSGYPSEVKRQELIWAEKGARKKGEEEYERRSLDLGTKSPMLPGTPKRSHDRIKPAYIAATSATYLLKTF